MSTAPDLLTVPQRTPSASAAPLVDMHGRRMGYLRVSVTPHCNFRCVYCRPATGDEGPPADQVLTAEEIVRVCRVAGSLGFAKVRLTGGEPLVRRGIADLVRAVRELPGVDEVAMTTNASLLHVHAASLKAAGLGRVNVSLDTLRR
ncbi:MAG TPA: radical SAM protein, partial [Tepidisphaeraceae bacterium]|nr:radical SAM protein [Tepidisphaeraceae bacterium]